jgi:hypothetical protein
MFDTVRVFDLRGDHVFVQVVSITDQSSGTYSGLEAAYDNGDVVAIGVTGGMIGCAFTPGGGSTTIAAGSVVYDAAKHQYWQLSEQSGTIHCEASADSTTWASVGSFAATSAPLAPSAIRVRFRAQAPMATPDAGSFEVTDLNGGGGAPSTASWCNVSTLTDDFSDAAASHDKWDRAWTQLPMSPTEGWDYAGQHLNLRFGESDASAVYYTTSRAYDITGQRVSLEVLSSVGFGDGQVRFAVGNGSGLVLWTMWEGGFECDTYVPGKGLSQLQTATPSLPNNPQWVSLRESDGGISCEMLVQAGDGGMTWQTIAVATPSFEPTTVDVSISATAGSTYDHWTATFDNVDLPPVP